MLESNKQTVHEVGLNQKDFEAAPKLIGDRYVQHNPRIADRIEGFEAFIGRLRADFPALRAEVKAEDQNGMFQP